ncbi:unnamed protein product, partial [Rotaria magnacalcarata]
MLNENEIFISGLPSDMEKQRLFDTLRDMFSTVGSIKSDTLTEKPCIYLFRSKDDTTQLTGEATVTFEKKEIAEKAFENYNGKELEPQASGIGHVGDTKKNITNKIFICGLPRNMSEEQLLRQVSRVFSTVGRIQVKNRTGEPDIVLFKAKFNNNQLTGTATITYEKEEAAMEAITKYNEKCTPALSNARLSVKTWEMKTTHVTPGLEPGPLPAEPTLPDSTNEKLLKTANEAYPFHIFVERCRKAINNARVREASPAKFKKENKNAKREDKRAIALTDTRDIGKNQNTVVETQDLFRCSMCTKTFPTNASRVQHEKDKHSVGLLAEVPSAVTNDFDAMQPSLLDTRDEVINRINLPDDDNNLNQASANLNDTLVASQMNDSPESQANFSVYNESIGPNPADRKSTEIIELTDAQQNFLQFFGERILKRIREESGIERVNILTGKLELYGRAQSTRTMKTYLESSLNQQTADITAALAKYLNLKFKGPLTNACLNKYRVGISYREIVKNAEIVIAKPICERDEDENESDHDDKGLPSNVKRGGNHVQVTLCSDSSELLSEAINEFRNYLLITDSFLLTQDEVSFILKTQNFRTDRDRQNHIRNYFNDFVQSRKNCHVYVLIFPKKGSWCVQVKGFREHVDTIVLEMKNFLSKHVQTEQQIVISTPMTIYLRKKGSSDLNTLGKTLGIRIQPFSLDRFKSDEQDDKNSYLKLTGSISRVNDARNAVVTFLENLCEQERQYPCPSWDIATKIERKVRAHLIKLLDSKDCSAVGWLKSYSRTVRLETQPENTLTVVGFNEDATSNVFQQCENLIGEFLVWTPSDGEFDMIFQRLIVKKSPLLEEFKNEWDANIQLKRDPNSIIIWARSKMLVAEIQTAMLTLANKQPVRLKRRSESIRIPKNIRRFIDKDTKSLIDEARAQEVFLESRGGEVLIFRGPLDHVIKLKAKIDNIIKRVQEQVVERRLRFALVESDFLRANNYKVALRMEEETNTVIRYINVDSNDEKTNFVKIIFQNIRGQTIIVEIGDITKVEHVDAIVNGANGSLKHAGGVAKAIAKAAGPALDQECKELISNNGDLPIPVGRAVKTTAGNLPFKCVIHAISPHYSDGYQNKHPLLFASVLSALEVAESESCSSVALPAIGSKIKGFPLVVCANVVVQAIKQFFANYPRSKLRNIVLIDVDEAVSTAFEYEIRVDHRTPHLNNDDDDMMNCQAAPSTVKWCWQDKSGERMYNEDDTRQIENAFLRFRNSEIPNVPNNVPHSTIWNIFRKKDACDTCHAECFIENVKLRCDNLMSATLIDYELHFNRDKKKIVIEDPAALKNSFVVGYQLRKDTGKKCDIIRHPVQQQERTAPVVMSQNPLDLFYCVSEIGGGEWNLFGLCHQSVQEAEDKIRLAIEEVKVSETVSVKLDTNLDQHKRKIAEIG